MSGTKDRIEPPPPPWAARARSRAWSFSFRASIPPTALTAHTASTITIPILSANWKRSITRTPRSPESVETKAVTTIMPKTSASACTLVTPKIIIKIFTMARLTQPMMMKLIGSPR